MMWMVRNPKGQYAEQLLKEGVVGIGWSEVTPYLTGATTPAQFYEAVKKAYPDYKGQEIVNAGRQLYKFFCEMQEGATVVTYDSPLRTYRLGTIEGPVKSDPERGEPFHHKSRRCCAASKLHL